MRVQHLVSCAVISFVFSCGGQTADDNASSEDPVGSEDTATEADDSAGDDDTEVNIDGRTPPDSSTPSAEPEPADTDGPIGVDIGNPLPQPDDTDSDTELDNTEPNPDEPGTEPTTPAPSGTIEPDPPEPTDCSDVPVCRLACPEGTTNPLDENGCLQSCECVPECVVPEPDPAPGADALPAPGANPVLVPCQPPIEPEPTPEPEPVSVEPEPVDPCAEVSACDLACPEGQQHPVDANGCTMTCECVPADPLPICTMEGDWCLPDNVVSTALVAAPAPCCEGLSCQPQICDAESCPSSCQPAKDPCGGCEPGLVCIYQAGGPGPSHYTCAEETNPCDLDALCACIVDQGPCSYDSENQICQCDNGLE